MREASEGKDCVSNRWIAPGDPLAFVAWIADPPRPTFDTHNEY